MTGGLLYWAARRKIFPSFCPTMRRMAVSESIPTKIWECTDSPTISIFVTVSSMSSRSRRFGCRKIRLSQGLMTLLRTKSRSLAARSTTTAVSRRKLPAWTTSSIREESITRRKNLIRPGYLIGEGDNAKVDYGVGPYKLTKAPAAAAVPAKRPGEEVRVAASRLRDETGSRRAPRRRPSVDDVGPLRVFPVS